MDQFSYRMITVTDGDSDVTNATFVGGLGMSELKDTVDTPSTFNISERYLDTVAIRRRAADRAPALAARNVATNFTESIRSDAIFIAICDTATFCDFVSVAVLPAMRHWATLEVPTPSSGNFAFCAFAMTAATESPASTPAKTTIA